ncbi:hypothetical protein A2U01_0043532, partial [Trifolium medium]|nr:hypothetical protein [Trifolium medium]
TPRDQLTATNLLTMVDQIDQLWLQHMECVLTSDMLGSRASLPSNTAPRYMAWYFRISHPYIIHIPEGYSVRPAEPDVAVQEESPTESTKVTQLLSRLDMVRGLLKYMMSAMML